MIVDPTARPIPLTANLIDTSYEPVTALVLPEMQWPGYIRYQGRIFQHYFATEPVPTPEEIQRTQLYREIEVWEAP